jgi:hypothetical protein
MNSPYVVDSFSYNRPRRNLAARNRMRTVCYYSLKPPLSNQATFMKRTIMAAPETGL